VDEAALAINADVDLPLRGPRQHPDVPLVAILGLVHLRIPISILVLVPPAHSGSALVKVELGAADQGRINARALPHSSPIGLEVSQLW